MKHRHLLFALLCACDGASSTTTDDVPAARALRAALTGPGEVAPDGACALPTLFVGATCERHVVTCPGLEPATVNLVIAEPPAGVALRGTVLLGSGSMGATLIEKATIDGGESHFVSEMEELRARGYRLIQRAWQGATPGDRGWLRGTEGPDDSACRYATLVTWLADRYSGDEAAFCALGFSGGSVELALAMSRWGVAELLDHATLVSGPAGHFDTSCVGGPEADAQRDLALAAHPWECGATPLSPVLGDEIALLVDRSYGGAPVCSSRDPIHIGTLDGDSALGPDGVSEFPTTRLHVVLGMKDCGSGAATAGATFATEVLGADGPPVLIEVAGAGHSLHATPQGAKALRQVLRQGCRLP